MVFVSSTSESSPAGHRIGLPGIGARGRHSITRAATGRSVQVRAMKTYVIWEVGSGHGDILQEKALVASGSEPGQEKLKSRAAEDLLYRTH